MISRTTELGIWHIENAFGKDSVVTTLQPGGGYVAKVDPGLDGAKKHCSISIFDGQQDRPAEGKASSREESITALWHSLTNLKENEAIKLANSDGNVHRYCRFKTGRDRGHGLDHFETVSPPVPSVGKFWSPSP